MKTFFWALAFIMNLNSVTVYADDAAELSELLQAHVRLSANFQQYTLSTDNLREETAQGQLWMEGTDYFRWETQTPFPQLIISDGTSLWVFDPDLEQATRRSLGEGEIMTPARVLGGDIDTLRNTFEVTRQDAGEGHALFELTPLEEGVAEFQRLRMLFNGDRLAELLIEDGLGQRSLIMLTKVSFPDSFDPSMFIFKLPADVDLIDMEAN